MKCPKCGSNKAKKEDYLGKEIIICDECGYDESEKYEAFPEERSGRFKSQHSPYKTGGSRRSQ
ncbi:hypothetical protein COV16_05180 [Candidatus Woesearchaeota archaeon CG10_big_fil_rev_8_21_14_0_10_34_8]|jgi:transcription initiation factor TFIIIB Brf1 subunit/transcription initiation factor TFIIB|nr:MAG: hypothetical protein COV16_05180 [Candidatus Woesearchaeota archaeon CG10_big_fil_rev_8_21_14_0_10_34_8]